jgi:hypothetical protein
LLAHASMLLKFWDEAFLTATFLINRLPTPVLHHMSPIEKLFATKPAYSFLRTFGCVCWPNLRPYNTHKLAFRSKQCTFLSYSTHHKGYKCLDISTDRVYISLDVVFDETVYPFSMLHPNAGAHLRSEISLIPPSLVDPALIRGSTVDVTNLPKSTNPSMQQCALPKFPGAATSTYISVIAPGNSYFLAAVGTPVTDPAVTEDLGMRVDVDPIDSPALPSPSDHRFTRSRWQHIGSFPNSVDPSLSDPVLDSVPGWFAMAGADTELSFVLHDMEASSGSSVSETTTVVPSLIATPVAPFATDPVLGSSGPAGVGIASTDEASSTIPQQRGRTRLQNNIIQPKRLFPGMIRYVNFCATGEPESLSEVMHDPKWKHAMEEEFSALMKNGTWHLVPASQASNIIDCKWVHKVKR